MKRFCLYGLALTAALLTTTAVPAASESPARSASEPDPGQIEISVGRLLEQGHYLRRRLDDNVSKALLANYLDGLDYNHLIFLQSDIDRFNAKYATTLDDEIESGKLDGGIDIYDTFTKRLDERLEKVKQYISEDYKFDSNKMVQLNRTKAAWPKSEAEADQLWHDRIEAELLQEKLNEHPLDTPVKLLTRRYDQFARNIHEQTKDDAVKMFLNTLAQTYDPHSEYLSKNDLENFSINMRLSLVGIGAQLKPEDGYAKIVDLIPGGPAEVDGRLKVGDAICAVGQGDDPFEDTVGMKLDKVVEKIRGKKNTKVRLMVIPSKANDPAVRKVVDLVRDEVKLKDQAVKADLIEYARPNGRTDRIGWISLPSFYADMEHMGSDGARSTTRDVRQLLDRLKREGITGLVVDLRKNGGGSLEEAIQLTGLFIKKGPVVQVKDANGNVRVSKDRDPDIDWAGPMVVVTNRLSASASEIFAAALQDYGRAVIVGDSSTFGKGTVQQMLEIGRFIPFLGSDGNEAGALKLTIQKFYRIAGGSTQLRGVVSDIKLPSPYDHPDIGESSLKGPMPYDEVNPAPFDKWDKALPIKELRARSTARVASGREFRYVKEDLQRVSDRIAKNEVSLNEKTRRAEIAEDKARKEKRTAERAKAKQNEPKTYALTLDNVDQPQLELASVEKEKRDKQRIANGAGKPTATATPAGEEEEDEEEKQPDIDPVHDETLNIMADLVELNRSQKTASTGQ